MVNKTKIKNFIFAQAIADAFGYVVEFKTKSELDSQYGVNGFTWDRYKHSDEYFVSDDTQMSLFALNACLDDEFKQNGKEIVWNNYKDWEVTQNFQGLNPNTKNILLKQSELFYRRAPGNTCLYALSGSKMGTVHNPINDSKGCGGIMRSGVFGFFAENIDQAFDFGMCQAALTHGHPDAYLSAGFYSALVYGLLNNLSLPQAMEQAEKILETYHGGKIILQKLNAVKWLMNNESQLSGDSLTSNFGLGWVGDEALMLAIYCSQTSISWEEMLEKSVNHDGDSDSVAMLTAGLWILQQKEEVASQIIEEYKEKVEVRNVINLLLEKINN